MNHGRCTSGCRTRAGYCRLVYKLESKNRYIVECRYGWFQSVELQIISFNAHFICISHNIIYRMSQEEWTKLGRVFLTLNCTDITQNTYIQSLTVTEIMAIEKCGLLGCPRTVPRLWRHTRTLRMPGNETPLANIVMQWPWRDNVSAAAWVNYLET